MTVTRARLVLCVAACVLVATDCAPASNSTSRARTTAAAFLDRYVQADGRVVRRDQGGDTVSEGQAYALLLAEVAGRASTFRRVWAWTKAHLLRPDGLLSFHADARRVLDREPAADADLLAAWALTRYRGPARARYLRDGRRLARALLAHELAYPQAGAPVLAAGPWATPLPARIDPSYFSPVAFRGLGSALPDGRWRALDRDALSVTQSLTTSGQLLPPDWAYLDAGGATAPIPAPGAAAARVQYGLDAQRLVVWFASACDADMRSLAARWWSLLQLPDRAGASALSISGDVLDSAATPLPLVAAAAAAGAAGDRAGRDRLLDRAQQLDSRYPTYYGSAWVALGRALLTTRLLGGCAIR
jgi:endoglucanase